jgi:hypothetical protein
MPTDLGSDQTTNLSNLSVGGVNASGVTFGQVITPLAVASRISSNASALVNELWASSISYKGAALPSVQFSTSSFNVVLHVVQGSASSFTVATSAAIKKGDILIPNPFGGAGVSSISSGLVWTSHATQDGQFEFRYSNVSTLVQNQSAQTFNLGIIRLV